MKIHSWVTMLNESGNPYLAKRNTFTVDGRCSYSSPQKCVDFINNALHLGEYAEEYVWILCFDTKFHLIGCFEVTHGTVNMSVCSPREIFQKSLMIGAASIAMVHNHPSGDPSPSKEDVDTTNRVLQSGNIIGVNLLDSLIVGRNGYFSLKESGMI